MTRWWGKWASKAFATVRGLIDAAIIDDEHFGPLQVHGAIRRRRLEALDALYQSIGLIEGRDYDREFQ